MDQLPLAFRRGLDALYRLEFAGNNALRWLGAVVLFIGVGVILRYAVTAAVKRLKPLAQRTPPHIDDMALRALENVPGWIYAIAALFLCTRPLSLPSYADKILLALFLAAMLFTVSYVANKVAVRTILRLWSSSQNEHVAAALGIIVNIVLWGVGLVLILSNLGVEVMSLVASLGIGGIAVALAAQNILGDVFSAFSLYFDKPFTIGDFIVTKEHMGVVKKIGLKTTRIQALQGEEIAIPNQELTASRVQNYKRMHDRRVEFEFRLPYGTPVDIVEKIPGIVEDIIKKKDLTKFDRAHLKQFGESSLEFNVVYYVKSADYNQYMDVQQAINVDILRALEREGTPMAIPAQSVRLEQSFEKRP